jgi:hypothetical protein
MVRSSAGSYAQRQRIAVQGNSAGHWSGATILDTFLSSREMHTSPVVQQDRSHLQTADNPKAASPQSIGKEARPQTHAQKEQYTAAWYGKHLE